MLRWPNKLKPLRDDTTLVSSIDLGPTILAACGLKPTDAMPGTSLLGVSDGQPIQRNTLFGEIFEHDEVDRRVHGRCLGGQGAECALQAGPGR
jgi:uncharacterized sulfatase